MRLQYLSHSAFKLSSASGKSILIDPYLDANPLAKCKSTDINADYIILTHAHGDHLGDAFKIAKRCGSLIICVSELAGYCVSHGLRAHAMHIGGSHSFDFGRVKLTIAHHGSLTPDMQYAGPAAGVILGIDGVNIYHTGDTGLFYDMKLIGEQDAIDYLLLPIGDNFTMGIDDAVKAVQLVNPRIAIPMHYNTFPLIQADPLLFKSKIHALGKNCIVLQVNEEIELGRDS